MDIKFRGYVYSIGVLSNGRIQLGFDGWLMNTFGSENELISHIEEQARWVEGAITARRLPARSREKITAFLAENGGVS